MSDRIHSASTIIGTPEGATQAATTPKKSARWVKLAGAGLGVYALAIVATGVYWSLEPAAFDVRAVALERVSGDESRLSPGVITVSAVGQVARTLLEKPGGYLHNDVSLPSIYLDNMPSWEDGVLKEVRDSLGALRNDFSRSQTQSVENRDLRKAVEFLNYDGDSWILPATESEFREGIDALDRYLSALVAGDGRTAAFYPRADNLAAYLAVVEKRLGSYAQRLSASVGDTELTAALVAGSEVPQAPGGPTQARIKTPWLEIDNIFYEARGYSWALLHTLKALAIDLEAVLKDKNAEVSMQQVIRDLEGATDRMWSPMVLNGQGFSFVANHSLVLASYIARANTAVLDLRILLQQG
jgi:hypothetical protein